MAARVRSLEAIWNWERAGPGASPGAFMQLARVSLSLFGMIGVVCAVLAGATIWLLLTNPVTVADAVQDGAVTPFVRELASVLYQAFSGLLKYL